MAVLLRTFIRKSYEDIPDNGGLFTIAGTLEGLQELHTLVNNVLADAAKPSEFGYYIGDAPQHFITAETGFTEERKRYSDYAIELNETEKFNVGIGPNPLTNNAVTKFLCCSAMLKDFEVQLGRAERGKENALFGRYAGSQKWLIHIGLVQNFDGIDKSFEEVGPDDTILCVTKEQSSEELQDEATDWVSGMLSSLGIKTEEEKP